MTATETVFDTAKFPRNARVPTRPAIKRRRLRWSLALAVAVMSATGQPAAQAAPTPLLVAGSPEYDQVSQTGLNGTYVMVAPGSGVNNSGTAVGSGYKYIGGGYKGLRPVRWDASGTAEELGTLGVDSGAYQSYAYAINDTGTAVGQAYKYDAGFEGYRAVRWDGSGTTATELGHLGLNNSGRTLALAHAINDEGTAVGYSEKYVNGGFQGRRAVRWDGTGTAATELGHLGLNSSGAAFGLAFAVNDAGTAVGHSEKYIGGISQGHRAVRWDGSGTAATELGHLGLNTNGSAFAVASAVNDAGMAVGYSQKYLGGSNFGYRAVRWDAAGTAATELEHLGLNDSGGTSAQAYDLNNTGTAVGDSQKYVGGIYQGHRAVRWDVSGTAATELGNLGLNSSGVTLAGAYAVNDAGTAVGYSQKYVGGSYHGDRAVIWLPDASAIDLNDLGIMPVPAGGTWTLAQASALSSDGWVAGTGRFDSDGGGPLAAYDRAWVTQVGLGTWTDDFTGSLDGTWGRGRQWSTGTPAMQVGNATFITNGSYTVSLDRDELTNAVLISAGSVRINDNGFTLTALGGLTIAHGATLHGAGTIIGDVMVEGAISPGNSPCTMPIVGNSTWASGGSLLWEINKADGVQGADPGWDLYDVTGVLTIAAVLGNEFIIDLATLTLANSAGQMDGFNELSNYNWTIATADGGIVGFDAGKFLLNTAGFANFFAGSFALSQSGNSITLNYTAPTQTASMPEPAAATLVAFGGLAISLRRRRRVVH